MIQSAPSHSLYEILELDKTLKMKLRTYLTRWRSHIFKTASEPNTLISFAALLITVCVAILGDSYFQFISISIFIGLLLFLLYIFRPERLLSSELLASTHQSISLDRLKDLDSDLLIIGVVGETQTGKSTFIHHTFYYENDPPKTVLLEARVVALPNVAPFEYCALIDGDGTTNAHQFDICKYAEYLFVFLDHNTSDVDNQISDVRLEDHDRILSQLRKYLITNHVKPKYIHFVLNKQDLWGEHEESRLRIVPWFKNIVNEWSDFGMANEVLDSTHSNLIATDINNIVQSIRNKAG